MIPKKEICWKIKAWDCFRSLLTIWLCAYWFMCTKMGFLAVIGPAAIMAIYEPNTSRFGMTWQHLINDSLKTWQMLGPFRSSLSFVKHLPVNPVGFYKEWTTLEIYFTGSSEIVLYSMQFYLILSKLSLLINFLRWG